MCFGSRVAWPLLAMACGWPTRIPAYSASTRVARPSTVRWRRLDPAPMRPSWTLGTVLWVATGGTDAAVPLYGAKGSAAEKELVAAHRPAGGVAGADGVQDPMDVSIDPTDERAVLGSLEEGLIEIVGQEIVQYWNPTIVLWRGMRIGAPAVLSRPWTSTGQLVRPTRARSPP